MLKNFFFATLCGTSRSSSLRVDVTLIQKIVCYDRRFMIFDRDKPHVLALLTPNSSGLGVEWQRYRYHCQEKLQRDLGKIYEIQNNISDLAKQSKTSK